MNIKKIPLSLYIHIPWCVTKCNYCDFHSYKIKKNDLYDEYCKHILNDLLKDIQLIENRKINSIFIGGGTPSILNPNLIKNLLFKINKLISFKNNIEITIEINPNNFNKEKLIIYKNSGINRISIGVQSFENKKLKLIGRDHKKNNIIDTIKIINNNKIKNFNIDIMYGLPQQTVNQAINDIKKAISLKPSHISWYQLTIEPKTLFYSNPPILPNDTILYNIYEIGNKLLNKSGYIQYEISSYANKNFKCKHNLNYWKFGDYIGIGCGAHGKITKKNGIILRTLKVRHPKKYMLGKYLDKCETVLKKDIPLEYFMNRFRLNEYVLKSDFFYYTQLNLKYIRKMINKAIYMKFIKETSKYFILKKKGKLFLNSLLQIFIK
ncbi:radical SAM family heme chaperone HemW [Sodalis-like secondary symbiont of Drepanosiphum platanoidis]|uniref:radical SAM family heme chaperone HemW n=1 Tax=Sodalis-like secondary symbiont of Drepanosiphum platanoidis TaxID=2994493 RepID=UPI003464766C